MVGEENYNPSGVLFRRAFQASRKCRTHANDQPSSVESRAREIDECIIVIVLLHAAVETSWHWEFSTLDEEQVKWPEGFFNGNGLKRLAVLREKAREDFPQDLKDFVRNLSAYRNFLQHCDKKARDRISSLGIDIQIPNDFDADLAESLIDDADAYFEAFTRITGSQRVGPSSVVWTGFDT